MKKNFKKKLKCQRNLESGIKKALKPPWGRKRDMCAVQCTAREYSSTTKKTQSEGPRDAERRIRDRTRNCLRLG